MIHQLYSRGLLTLFNFLSLIFFFPSCSEFKHFCKGKKKGGKTKVNNPIQIVYSFKLGTFCFKCTICSFNPTVFPVSGSSP